MSVDNISNFISTLRNVISRAGKRVMVTHTKLNEKISDVLFQEGFIKKYSVFIDEENKKKLIIELKYVENESVIHEIKQISTQGRRVYSGKKNIPIVIGGLGIAILTTNTGVITDKKARLDGIGGEIICTVW